ncbi:HAD hydrolase-like protein, partial [uncultured Duncaniella sp.]
MKQLIIFDLDGTLLNTIADLGTATNHALRACGFPQHNLASYPKMVGNGITRLIERALPEDERTPETIDKVRTHFKE